MGILANLFKKEKQEQKRTYSEFKELGTYRASFTTFGKDIYKSDDVRTCIRALAEHTSKANPRCKNDKRIERILQLRPNKFMNGKDFLAKVRNYLEIRNTAFVYINRDNTGKVIEFYPVPYQSYTALEFNDRLFIRFKFDGSNNDLVVPWDDLAVLRKDYVFSEIGGEDNKPLLPTLEVISTMDKGLQNAVKSTANLRGILKSTKAMLSPEDLKRNKEQFVKDYMDIENEGGIASLDATQEFKEINLKPTTATAEEADAYRDRVYRYFGVNEKIIKSTYSESEYDAFYESRIEPFLVALALEFTYKIFTEREIAFGAEIWYESNRLQFASAKTKISMVSLVDRGLMTPNEYRALFNLSPYEGGDEFILRLDTSKTGDSVGNDGTGNPVGRPPKDDTVDDDDDGGNEDGN